MSGAATPLRLLMLTETYHPEVGGGERQAGLLGAALAGRGHSVTIVTRRSRPGLARLDQDGRVRVRRLAPEGRGRHRKWGLALTSLAELLRHRDEYDIVLVSGFRILGVPALLARRRTGRATVLKADSCGEMSGEYFRPGLSSIGLAPDTPAIRRALAGRNALLRRADAFVAVSRDIAEELLACGVSPHRVQRIGNCVDTAAFRPASEADRGALRKQLELPGGPIVVYTGRLVTYKGLPILLRAWRHLAPFWTDGLLVLVGESGGDIHGCERELREFVAAEGLQTSVRFAGAVANVESWLRAADVFAFPTETEAFGLSLVEAMACGLACVSTSVGGLRDLVENGVNCVTVAPRDELALRDALASLIADKELADRVGAGARRTVECDFAVDAIADRYEALFRQVLDAQRTEAAT